MQRTIIEEKDNLDSIFSKQNNREEIMQMCSSYNITIDNFVKMSLIYLRSKANIPIIIMGDAGVGKTALVRFMVKVILQ